MIVQPYLFFEGRAAEALEFYQKALGATVGMMLRFKDSPDKSMCTPANQNSVMHAAFKIGETTIMASDGMSKAPAKFEGFSLSISVKSVVEADKMFAALTEGGTITMPPTKTFFSPKFGMVKDKFGVHWMVLVES